MASLQSYNSGEPDTTAYSRFFQANTELKNASYNSLTMITSAKMKYYNDNASGGDTVRLGVLNFSFNLINPDADTNIVYYPQNYRVTIYSNCGFAITASPNPTANNVTVAVKEQKNALYGNKQKAMMYQIKVTDQSGNVKKQYKYSSGTTNTSISLSGLISGLYTLQAFDGTSWSSTKVIKQ